ncbi:alpha/beta fold hydrolase [Streptomyces sp. NPDC056291]|uniref:alpha/beta fold hydrolase n=1 Tax=Streptomyces sp. NPDC056291 TaxID=3345772 RepID=UPI0035D80402
MIRYDRRDTGRWVTYEPGRPGYTGADLVGDAARVLDAYEIPAAHVVGVSAGGHSRNYSCSVTPVASSRSS